MSSASMKPWPRCNCASYNAATPGDPEVILTIKDYFPEMISDRETVCVDRCIAPVVQLLWQAGIWTLNSCCGHNKEAPSIITEQPDAERALSLLLKGGFPQVRVLAWKLCDCSAGAVIQWNSPTVDPKHDMVCLVSFIDQRAPGVAWAPWVAALQYDRVAKFDIPTWYPSTSRITGWAPMVAPRKEENRGA